MRFFRTGDGLGGALGLGCLVKQTFILYTLPLALWALWRLRIHGLVTITISTLVAGPWYLTHLSEQNRLLASHPNAYAHRHPTLS